MSFILTWVVVPILFAELVNGLIHWWEDRYGNPDWPFLGRHVVRPNILHHERPAAMLKGSYWHRNNTTIIPALALAACFYWCLPLALGCLILSQANEVHGWTHQKCNWLIRGLQRTGLLQSPRHHAMHHRRPYDRNYCTMTNYVNPVLTRLRFWESLEGIIYLVLRVKPRPERALA